MQPSLGTSNHTHWTAWRPSAECDARSEMKSAYQDGKQARPPKVKRVGEHHYAMRGPARKSLTN